MSKTRLIFSKTGRAKFISHLDTMRTMHRAFLRAGINLKYSEGFNPHPHMSVALPLSVGCGSLCELIDFEQLDSVYDILERLNAAMPDGIEVIKAYTPVRKFSEIKWCEMRGRLFFDNGTESGLAQMLLQKFEEAPEILIQKKTKRGTAELDVKPHITGVGFYETAPNEITVSARLSASEPVLNHGDLLKAVSVFLEREPDFTSFRRVELYDAGHNVFR